MRLCATPGCPTLTRSRRCPQHAREHEHNRGTRQQRGYDTTHDQLRTDWAPRVATGRVRCANPNCHRPNDPLIHPGEPWDLGHTADRSTHRGPEHEACNRSEGGRTAHHPGG